MYFSSTPATSFLLLTSLTVFVPVALGFMLPSAYQADQGSIVYKMPRRHSSKFKVFAECRRDCASKCNHSLYAYLANKNDCFTCLLECMSVFTEQAEKMGIQIDAKKSKKKVRHVTGFGATAAVVENRTNRYHARRVETPNSHFKLSDFRRSQ